MSKYKKEFFDSSFYTLAGEITKAIEENKLDGTTQKEQVEELLDAERKFRDTVLKYRQSTEVYKKFLQKICLQNKNILSARPYFRESAISFSAKITPAIKASDVEALKTFDINFQLIKFIKDSWLGPFPKRADQLYERVRTARDKLIQNNAPLAINRAKLFYRKTPRSHLTLMDLIGISLMGFAAGVDKYVGAYSPVFRSVLIGRAVGNMIDNYSETMMHFYPQDKRILYKANAIRGRQGIHDPEELAEAVNESFKQDEVEGKTIPKNSPGTESITNTSELNSLMQAASMVSADSTVDTDGYGVYTYTQDSNPNAEEACIERETENIMLTLAKNLPILHKKVLRLKGIKL
jgi:DNA-directed RNA polymerase specialized sigma subunit